MSYTLCGAGLVVYKFKNSTTNCTFCNKISKVLSANNQITDSVVGNNKYYNNNDINNNNNNDNYNNI